MPRCGPSNRPFAALANASDSQAYAALKHALYQLGNGRTVESWKIDDLPGIPSIGV